jgi:hypothetical protein
VSLTRILDEGTEATTFLSLLPLFPRIMQSPYLALSWPFSNSSVCSMAMFKYPSRQARTPRYSIPELSFTRTGLPITDFKKSDGDLFGFSCASASGAVA